MAAVSAKFNFQIGSIAENVLNILLLSTMSCFYHIRIFFSQIGSTKSKDIVIDNLIVVPNTLGEIVLFF